MSQDVLVRIALMPHNGGTYLTHSYTMAPALAVQDDGLGNAVLQVFQADGEGTAKQVRGAERLTYHQLLTYYICALGADDTEAADMSGRSGLQGFQA